MPSEAGDVLTESDLLSFLLECLKFSVLEFMVCLKKLNQPEFLRTSVPGKHQSH